MTVPANSELLLFTADFDHDETSTTVLTGIWSSDTGQLASQTKVASAPLSIRTGSGCPALSPSPSVDLDEHTLDVEQPCNDLDLDLDLDLPAVESRFLSLTLEDHVGTSDSGKDEPASLSGSDDLCDRGEEAATSTSKVDIPICWSPKGAVFTKHMNGIRNVPNAFTTWIATEEGTPLEIPPVFHPSVHLEIGDLFIQFHTTALPQSASQVRRTARIWLVIEDEDGMKLWRRCSRHPITHPIYDDRLLAFVATSPDTPTWIKETTRKGLSQKSQPRLIGLETDIA
ncbi:unnamed protein product [Peniophora sp. CBMAI 1063]|nr:unnamed protein product [Peniophora sp. CBMAI 1063]